MNARPQQGDGFAFLGSLNRCELIRRQALVSFLVYVHLHTGDVDKRCDVDAGPKSGGKRCLFEFRARRHEAKWKRLFIL